MNTDINPGAPATDPLAKERFRTALAEAMSRPSQGPSVQAVIDLLTSVRYETDINANGVPVRRYALRGEWEVDPQPPAYEPRKGDVVRYLTGEPVVTHDGTVPADAEWIVSAVPFKALDPNDSLVFLRQPEWVEGTYINTSGRLLQIVRRPR